MFLNRVQSDPEIQRRIAFAPFRMFTFHKRKVTRIPKNFQPLAMGNEMLECCESPIDGGVCQILSIQCHPEYDGGLVKAVYNNTEGYVKSDEARLNFLNSVTEEPNNDILWRAIMNWVVTTRRRSSSGTVNMNLPPSPLGVRSGKVSPE